MSIVTEVLGQYVAFDDESNLRIPPQLTITELVGGYALMVDDTKREIRLLNPVTKARLVTAIDVLLVNWWVALGRPENRRPKYLGKRNLTE